MKRFFIVLALMSLPVTLLVLRGIRDFYEINSLRIPSNISVILNEVPRDR